MADVFLSAFLQVLFDRLTPRARDMWNFARREGLEKKLEELEQTFRAIETVLADAEEKQLTLPSVEWWLDDLRRLAYDAEDVLDEFVTEGLRQQVMVMGERQSSTTSKLSSLVSTHLTPTAIKFKLKMGSKIEAITRQLEAISNRKDQLGLVGNVGAPSGSTNTRQVTPTTSTPIEAVVYGRDGDKKNIIKRLLKDEPCFRVMHIVGMGGIGKTTLVQYVYNDQAVVQAFHTKAWVCVPYDFDVKSMMKAILEDVTSQPCKLNELQPIQAQLERALAGKRFLIVLDDIWGMVYENWLALTSPFRVGAPGSKIITTSRLSEIGLMMGAIEPYTLKRLLNDDCWSVFKTHALKNLDIGVSPNLESIRETIIQKCNGSPLAARSLGGLLCCKPTDHWEAILNTKMRSSFEAEFGVLPVLRMSYYYLSPELKRCFAYCAIFPRDYEFTEKELVHLWIAEGFIQKLEENKQASEVGGIYFRELVSRSIFQASNNHESRFFMHDLMHKLAADVASNTCSGLNVLEFRDIPSQIGNRRHLSYCRGSYDRLRNSNDFHGMKNLRTFLPLPIDSWHHYLSNRVLYLLPMLKRLRVLSLSGYNITELPNSIGDLKHLRYLNLSYTEIRGLPESICSLYNLQVLLLRGCSYLQKLPSKMENLINFFILILQMHIHWKRCQSD